MEENNFKMMIYASTANSDVYTLCMKILAAVYNKYVTKIKDKHNSDNVRKTFDTFLNIAQCIETEYNFNKNDLTTPDKLVNLSTVYNITNLIDSLFNTYLIAYKFRIDIVTDIRITNLQQYHVDRLFYPYIEINYIES